jgi:hypothetical protein
MSRTSVLLLLAITSFVVGCGGGPTEPSRRTPPRPSFDAELVGRVRDSASGAPIADADIAVVQLGNTFAKSRADGSYRLFAYSGSGRLNVSALGYENVFQEPITIHPGVNAVDIPLTRRP